MEPEEPRKPQDSGKDITTPTELYKWIKDVPNEIVRLYEKRYALYHPRLRPPNSWNEYDRELRTKAYKHARKCVIKLRVKNPNLPALPQSESDATIGLQSIQEWCVEAGGKPKKTKTGWTADRVNVAIHDHIEQNKSLYERLRNECTKGTGNKEAQKEWRDNFGPESIARKIGQGLRRQRVQESSVYRTMLDPVLRGIPPLGRGQRDADDDIDKARERAGGRK